MKPALIALVGVLVIAGLAPRGASAAPDLSARDIMEKNFFVTKPKTLKSDLTMILVNDKGQTRERKSTTLSKLQSNGVDSRLLVRFDTPADIKGTGFLQIEHSDADDDLWIYLPALKKTRRLVANNKKDSFVGSDFSYGDVLLPKVDLFRHTLLRMETVGGHECHVIESLPRDDTVKRDSGYGKKITWVRKDNFLEAKVEYYDINGRLLKTQTTADHRLIERDPARWIAAKREMLNHQTGHKTVLGFERIEAGIVVADEIFTTRTIERE